MKVLCITNMYPYPGRPYFGIFVKNQIESLEAQGLNIKTIFIGRYFGGYKKILNIKEKVKWASLIHCHFGHTGSLTLPWKYLYRKPLVVSYCGDDLLGKIEPSGKVNFFHKIPSIINSYLSRFVDCAIAKSYQLARKIRCKKIEVIPNGVDLSFFREVPKDEALKKIGLSNHSRKIILFLGQRDNPVKNYSLFCQVLKYLDFEFKVLALENIPYEEVVYYLNASDVCVLTSIHEGSPNVVKEALSCNRPVVSVDVGDVNILLKDVKGCFITPHDPCEIASSIKKALKFEKSDGRRRIKELGLSLESVAERIIGIYRSLVR